MVQEPFKNETAEPERAYADQQEAFQRDQAMVVGESGVEWLEMKVWLYQRLQDRLQPQLKITLDSRRR